MHHPLPGGLSALREKLARGEHAEEIGRLFDIILEQHNELIEARGQAMDAVKRVDQAQRAVKERDGIIASLNRQIAAMRDGATET